MGNPLDEIEIFSHAGRQFLCSGEQLPSKDYQAVVRHRATSSRPIRTLVLGSERHTSSWRALVHAKELAVEWTLKHSRADHEQI